jgi:aspartate aminotransferase
MSPEDMTEVVKLAHQRGIWVISDECYVYLNYTGKRFSVGSLREYRDRFMVVGSLSKTYAMTGWRLGFTLGPAPIIAAVQKAAEPVHVEPDFDRAESGGRGASAAATMRRRHAPGVHQAARSCGQRTARIPGVKCTLPEGAFYAYPNVSAFFGRGGVNSASDIAGKLLREKHVATVPGEGFGTKEHIRISYATSVAELDRGLERMHKFFGGL